MKDVGFSGSYDASDVIFLLKPVTLEPTNVTLKEALIQSGARHYSEMLSPEARQRPNIWRCMRQHLFATVHALQVILRRLLQPLMQGAQRAMR